MREAEIWEELVYLTECPHCEARMIVEICPQPDLTVKLVCETCSREFVGLYDIERTSDT